MKTAFLHAEVFANTFNIGRFEAGRIIFATGGALKAVNFLKSFLVQCRELFNTLFLSALAKKAFKMFLTFFTFFLPLVKCIFGHDAKNRKQKLSTD